MGGMGRTIPGSYAEYTRVRAGNVASIDSSLIWEDLAAIPEYTQLPGHTLLVRGGISSFGQAAINLAVNAGAKVIATTRNLDRAPMLLVLGVKRVELEGPELLKRLPETSIDVEARGK
ncbi:hypothetical protein VC83_02887 [Pseudogymnoascus destructans]|uniref:Alcohol dehydrogenase-like C-terminal domain-containing protein n=1 Tax=Pseudogymnoascus destructans TaxID=655981 RepID=A0A177ACQ8_9PEZI|nr:uncharacterized protein VC83_02887 [Pseudogymnoascus destructans]OAF59895.1 hypothetical protein VC83_02887 [Pseudogymnoascus destructans]